MINWDEYYELIQWHGMDNYSCNLCPYATVGGVDEILNHLRSHFPGNPRVLSAAPEITGQDEEE